ncbi:amidohydrolase [Leekyejoonella antrihumi]|uniref:Amidohydrolase n=1 Tax=Leekyejoonella antrihumi TaxID=1660198 RepID=A0A563DXS7_9MICO|nr:amidohydrolase [Leekyejoonella antrihumi]TWP34929.1 amidohydrolase [Leekyejoonella antrihumi]
MTTADLVFHNGVVHPIDPALSATDALAVRDDRIVALGDDAVALKGAHTELIDLAGGALLPGFQDAHIHAVAGGLQRLGCNLEDVHSLDDYRSLIAAHAQQHPDDEWLAGAGWYGDVFEGGYPHRKELDQIAPGRAMVIVSHDAHGAWASSEALRRAGINRHTPDPDGGRIVRDAAGEPTGMLIESAADLVTEFLPEPDEAQLTAALLEAQRYLHGLGITAWQDAAVGAALAIPDTFETYRTAAATGRLTARVTGALWWDRVAGMDQVDFLRERRAAACTGNFRATAVKIMQDGVCENLTAAVFQAYQGHEHEHGLSFIEPDELATIVRRLDAERFDLHLHAVGDRAVHECLDATASRDGAAGGPAAWDPRHQIAHIDLIRRDDVMRMRELGVIANLQPLWAREDRVLVETKLPYLSEDQQGRHFAFRSLHGAGVRIALGSDWPVSSPDPLWGIHTAVNRTAPAGDPHAHDDHAQHVPLLASESIDLATALHGYTQGAAYANRLDDCTGTLRPGSLADLVLLDQDPYAVPSAQLGSLKVRATLVGGQVVHDAM